MIIGLMRRAPHNLDISEIQVRRLYHMLMSWECIQLSNLVDPRPSLKHQVEIIIRNFRPTSIRRPSQARNVNYNAVAILVLLWSCCERGFT